METNIIVQGFKEAESKYGLRYTTFVGDGDSSLHPNLISGVPGWGHAITKSECANNAMKCYRGSLERLVQEKTHYKGKGKLTESMRKKLTKAARCAIKMRSAHSNKAEAVRLLREDLCNGPYHCFGDHSQCNTDYCKVKKLSQQETTEPEDAHNTSPTNTHADTAIYEIAHQEQRLWQDALNEENLEDVRHTTPVSQDIDREMMCDIQRLVSRFIAKSEQLLGKSLHCMSGYLWLYRHIQNIYFDSCTAGNFTTNLVESWMHIQSKFDGGKQINRSQSGSWQGICAGAGLRQVVGPAWGPEVWRNTTGSDANPVFTANSMTKEKQVSQDRKQKAKDTERERRKQVKYRKTNDNSQKARSDYARHDDGRGVKDTVNDVPQEYLEQIMLDYYTANVKVSDHKRLNIEQVTTGQCTPEDIGSNIWLAERRKRITSSNTGVIAKRRAKTKVANVVKSLLYCTFRGNVATEWGKLQEPATCQAYIDAKDVDSPAISVKSSGLVIHPEHHWLAASPDGLVTDPAVPDPTRIVEFKNPHKHRDSLLKDAASEAKDFCLTLSTQTSSLRLKKSHHYYYQIQAAMFCTRVK